MRLPSSIVLLAAAILAGCAGQERRPEAPEGPRSSGEAHPAAAPEWSGAAAAASSAPATDDRSLDEALRARPTLALVREAARRRSPEIALARAASAEARGKAGRAGPIPDPMARWSYSSMFEMHSAEVSQTVPFPLKLTREADAARAEARAVAAQGRVRAAEVVAAATLAYADLALARSETALLDEGLALARRVVEAARARYAAGRSGQADVLRAETEEAALRAERAARAEAAIAAEGALNLAVDRHPLAPLGPLEPLPAPATATAALDARVLSIEPLGEPAGPGRAREPTGPPLPPRPALDAADARAAAADAALARAEAERLPDLTLSGAYVRDVRNREDEFEVGAGVTLPLWFGRISSGIDEARASRDRAWAEKRIAWIETARAAQAASTRARAAALRFAILDAEAVPRAQAAVDAALASYAAGQSDLAAVIDAQRALLAQALERERARVDHASARALEERTLGTATEARLEDDQ